MNPAEPEKCKGCNGKRYILQPGSHLDQNIAIACHWCSKGNPAEPKIIGTDTLTDEYFKLKDNFKGTCGYQDLVYFESKIDMLLEQQAAQTRRDTIEEAVKVVHGHNGHNDPHPHLHYSACNDDIIFQLQALNETTKSKN